MKAIEHLKMHREMYIGILMGLLIALIFSSMLGHGGHHDRHTTESKTHMSDKMGHDSEMETTMIDMTGSLKGKTGDAFDKAFLNEMTVHHEGAVAMARLALTSSKRPEIIQLANEIIASQTREITKMNTWRNTWFTVTITPTPAPRPTPTTPAPVQPVACTMEARICPDGSAVGRQGPNCEFAECPRY